MADLVNVVQVVGVGCVSETYKATGHKQHGQSCFGRYACAQEAFRVVSAICKVVCLLPWARSFISKNCSPSGIFLRKCSMAGAPSDTMQTPGW